MAVLRAVLLLALIAVPAASLSFDVAAAKQRPVSKVVDLLKDMLQQLEKEAKSDQEIYDKMACWCETNDKEKSKAISDAQSRITALTSKIEELTAASARLNSEIKTLEREVAQNQASLDKATALRQKQIAEFQAEEKEMLGSISALKAAVTVLSKHQGAALLQAPRSHVLGVVATLQHELQVHSRQLAGVLTHAERRAVQAFIQSPYQAYAPQGGEIFGVLNSMKDTFEHNLSAAQKQELANSKAYDELKTAKRTEIEAGIEQIDAKTQELATTDENLAHAKQDIEDTKKSLSADEAFLLNLREKCQSTDAEWEERQKTRNAEMEAVSKALAVLSSDDAKDLFSRNFNPSLLQRRRIAHSARRQQVAAVLSSAAKKFHSPELAALAVTARLDAFDRVKQAIDDMVSQLLKQKEDEIKHKDFCNSEFNENQLQTEKADRQKEDLDSRIETQELSIKELTDAIAKLQKEIADMQFQVKRASENRETENKEFQAAVTDQRETQALLQQALQVLGEFYRKNKAALMQKQPEGFSKYKNNANSGGVMALLETIIADSKAAEADVIRSEDDAQKAYEDFVKESNTAIEAKTRDITNKSADKAKAEADLVAAKEARDGVVHELEQLSNYNAQLHQSCDFVLKNFDLRQTARDEEVEALKQAKAILSGAKFTDLLQTA